MAAPVALPDVTSLIAEAPKEGFIGWRLGAPDAEAASRVAAVLRTAGFASVEPLEATSRLEERFLRFTASKAVH